MQNAEQLAMKLINEKYKLFAGLVVVDVPRLNGKLGVTIGENEVDDTYICTVVKINTDFPAAKCVYPGDCVLSVGGKSVQGCRLPAVLGAFKESTQLNLANEKPSPMKSDTVSIFIQRLMTSCPGMASPQPYSLVKDSIVQKLKQQKLHRILSFLSDDNAIAESSSGGSVQQVVSRNLSNRNTTTSTLRVVVKRSENNILGVKLKQNSDIPDGTTGKFYVSSVKDDSRAAEVLQPHDVVLAINDEDVTKFVLPQLIQYLQTLHDDVAFTIVRVSALPQRQNNENVKQSKSKPISKPGGNKKQSSSQSSKKKQPSTHKLRTSDLSKEREEDCNVANCSGCGKVGEFKRFYKPGRSYYKPHYIKASLSETGRIKRCGTFTVNPRIDLSYPYPVKDRDGFDKSTTDRNAGHPANVGDQDDFDFDFEELNENDLIAECSVCGKSGTYSRDIGYDSQGMEVIQYKKHDNGDCGGVFSKNPRVKTGALAGQEFDDDILQLLSNDGEGFSVSMQKGTDSSSSTANAPDIISDEEQELLESIRSTRAHIDDYRQALESAQLDEALESWTEAVQVLQKLYHNEQVFLLKYRLLQNRKKEDSRF